MAKAKGTNLLHMRTFVRERFGSDAWSRVLAELEPDAREELGGLVAVGWYDLPLQVELLRAIDRVLGKGDTSLISDIGEFEANQDLTRIHKLFMKFATPAYVLEKARDYWARFYDTGTWEVTRHAGRSASGTLRGLGVVDRTFCVYLQAYIYRMFLLSGAADGQIRHTRCRARGDDACTFEGSWRE